MQTNESVIVVNNVSKDFVLPHERANSVKSLFTGIARRHRGGKKEVQHALQNVSFDVKQGEFFGIVGRNGSGKSTMLKLLAGIYQPTAGSIQTRGRLVPFIELGVGFNAELTGRENVYLNGAMLGFSASEVNAMYDDIVKFAELERFMDQKLKNYSSGMQVRLAFSMATRAEADILLVDEVLAVGDADFQRKCFSYFKELKRKNKTIVFISHDMNSIREYCDRALLINDSKVIYEGSADRVATEYSKLFMTESGSKVNAGENRWGDGSAKIVEPTVQQRDDRVELSFTVLAEQELKDFLLGYVITDATGKQLCGTNTTLLHESLEPLAKGKSRRYTLAIENIFVDGAYSATIAVQKDVGTTTADWWTDAVSFTIKKAQHNPYLVEAPVVLSVKEKA